MSDDSESEHFTLDRVWENFKRERPTETNNRAPPEDNLSLQGLSLSLIEECSEQRQDMPERLLNIKLSEPFASAKDTKPTKNKKPLVFQHLGFTSPEQDLANL